VAPTRSTAPRRTRWQDRNYGSHARSLSESADQCESLQIEKGGLTAGELHASRRVAHHGAAYLRRPASIAPPPAGASSACMPLLDTALRFECTFDGRGILAQGFDRAHGPAHEFPAAIRASPM
jgi:hypothetical protein